MSALIVARPNKITSSVSTISISGSVVDPSSNPLARLVFAYYANNLMDAVDVTISDISTGAFSFELNGTENTEFACLVQGEIGENCVVYSHKTAD